MRLRLQDINFQKREVHSVKKTRFRRAEVRGLSMAVSMFNCVSPTDISSSTTTAALESWQITVLPANP